MVRRTDEVFKLFGHLTDMKERLEAAGEGLDYNRLSFEEKQAAQALVEANEARFAEFEGRTVVKKSSPRLWLRVLTMGAAA